MNSGMPHHKIERSNEDEQEKLKKMIAILIACVLVYRFFCKVLCSLGAIYSLFNKFSFYRLNVDGSKCVHCGKCARVCRMDIDPVKHPQSIECIRYGACAAACGGTAPPAMAAAKGRDKVQCCL